LVNSAEVGLSNGPEHPDVATSLNNLALLCHTQGQYAQAEPVQAGAGDPGKGPGPGEHPDVANSPGKLRVLATKDAPVERSNAS
jgi:hypothetical protein